MKRTWFKLLLIVLFSVALRLPAFLTDFVNIDENEYSIAAQKILAGGIPYKDFLIYQPPIIYYIFALGFFITGGTNIWSAQILTILFVVGTIIALYHLAKSLTKSMNAGLITAAAYGVFSATFLPQDMLAANCEVLMMLPITLSVVSLYHAEKQNSYTLYILAGILASVGVLTKYQGGVIIAAEGFYLLIITAILERRFSFKRNIITSFLLMVGFTIPIAILTLYLHRHGALQHAIEAWKYILLYAKGPVQSDPLYVFIKFIMKTGLFILPGIIMWIGSVSTIKNHLKKFWQARSLDMEEKFTLFSILWFFVSIIPIIVGGRIYFHYYFVILPPAATLFGIWWHEKGQRVKTPIKIAILVWLIICTAGWTTYSIKKPGRGLGKKDMWVHTADYLQSHASGGDTLFVWGYCPQIYIQSGLKSATRFTTTDYLTGRSPMTAGLEYNPDDPNPPSSLQKALNDFIDPPGVIIFDTSNNIFPKAWEYLEEDFKKALPTYIVDTSRSNYRRYGRYPISKYPLLDNLIKEKYDMVNTTDEYYTYRLRK